MRHGVGKASSENYSSRVQNLYSLPLDDPFSFLISNFTVLSLCCPCVVVGSLHHLFTYSTSVVLELARSVSIWIRWWLWWTVREHLYVIVAKKQVLSLKCMLVDFDICSLHCMQALFPPICWVHNSTYVIVPQGQKWPRSSGGDGATGHCNLLCESSPRVWAQQHGSKQLSIATVQSHHFVCIPHHKELQCGIHNRQRSPCTLYALRFSTLCVTIWFVV